MLLMGREWVALHVNGFRQQKFGVWKILEEGERWWKRVAGLRHRLEWGLRTALLVEVVGLHDPWRWYVQVSGVLDLVY